MLREKELYGAKTDDSLLIRISLLGLVPAATLLKLIIYIPIIGRLLKSLTPFCRRHVMHRRLSFW